MIYVITTGSYSDYAIVGLFEGPDNLDIQNILDSYDTFYKESFKEINEAYEHATFSSDADNQKKWWDKYKELEKSLIRKISNLPDDTEIDLNYQRDEMSMLQVVFLKQYSLSPINYVEGCMKWQN